MRRTWAGQFHREVVTCLGTTIRWGGSRVTEPETFAPFSANAARLREPHGLSHKAFERRRAEQKGAIDQNKAAVRI